MKTIQKFISWAALCCLIITSVVYAETPTTIQNGSSAGGSGVIPTPVTPVVIPTTLPMIGSQDLMREYALKSVVYGSRYVNAESMDFDYPDRLTATKVTGNSAEDVLNQLFSVEFRYRLANSTDTIRGYVYLYDNNENLVFAGSAEYIAGKQASYVLWMQSVSILHGVESAEVLALDEDGTTARRSRLQVDYRGSISFPSWMVGAENGLLVVKFTDGSLATYRLNNPKVETPESENEDQSVWQINGHYVYALAGGNPKVIKIIETWNLPTVYIEVAAGEVVTFDVTGIVEKGGVSFERPLGFISAQQDGPATVSGLLDFTAGLPQINMPFAGKYRIIFQWENFGQANHLYTGPDDGGGKG